jgi:putative spermidine/putrescine transport system ATP-binding protein
MAIEIAGVRFVYPGTEVGVFDVDLAVGDSELVAVIGASGSGKTTLLKLVAGFLRPERGRIALGGRDVTSLAVRERDLGIVFQSYALFPHMTAWQNVAYALKVRGVSRSERRRQAYASLASVGLRGFEERLPGTLSGGQQQRVALARALAFRPKGLLLDEPLSALDAALRVEMRDEIRRIQQEHAISTIHITHDQEEALSLADRVAVMEAGRLVQVATPRELYDRPATRSVARFVGQANLWDGTVTGPEAVETALGPLRTAPHGLPAGRGVTVLVRPENLAIDGRDHSVNRFEGRIVRDRFLGSLRRFDFAVGDRVILGETGHRGDIRAVSIPPRHVLLLDR